jgi:hypothetical protein
LEACSGAHEWARRFAQHGHTVKLMAPKFVAPYRKSGKNDSNDAEAICEAVSRPSMRFVPVKSVEQQAMLTLHRVRLGFVEERTATINRIRGLLAEFGVVLAQRAMEVRRGAAATLDQLPAMAQRALRDQLAHVRVLDERIAEYEQELEQHARQDERAKRIQKLSGIGPISASAIVASVADAHEFKNGRQDAARAHYGARRCVPSNTADHGRALDAADGAEANRSSRTLGTGCPSSARVSPRVRGHRSETRSDHLGDAGEERVTAARLRNANTGISLLTKRCVPKQQVRPASAEPDQLKGHQRPTNDRGTDARLTSGPGCLSSPIKGRLETCSQTSTPKNEAIRIRRIKLALTKHRRSNHP